MSRASSSGRGRAAIFSFTLGAVDEFHREEAVLFIDFEDRCRCWDGSATAAAWASRRKRSRFSSGVRRQKLQRDGAAKLGVFGLVDDTHPALAELFEDAVMGDGLAGHAIDETDLGNVRDAGSYQIRVRIGSSFLKSTSRSRCSAYEHGTFGCSRQLRLNRRESFKSAAVAPLATAAALKLR